MSKFTKGPWRVRKDGNGNTVVATMPEPSDILPGSTQSWHIAIVMGTPGKRDKQANANVMAASPDLYAALINAIGLLALYTSATDELAQSGIQSLKEALKKADGGGE